MVSWCCHLSHCEGKTHIYSYALRCLTAVRPWIDIQDITGLSSLWSLFPVLVVHEHFLVSLVHPALAKSSESKQCSMYPTRKEWQASNIWKHHVSIWDPHWGSGLWTLKHPASPAGLKESCGKQYPPILRVVGILVARGSTIICTSERSAYLATSLWDLVRCAWVCNACRRIFGSNPEAHLGG